MVLESGPRATQSYWYGGIIGCIHYDFPDAPSVYGNPSHEIDQNVLLGSAITRETTGYNDPNAAADADDGVTMPSFAQGQTSTIPVTVTGNGYLQAWID